MPFTPVTSFPVPGFLYWPDVGAGVPGFNILLMVIPFQDWFACEIPLDGISLAGCFIKLGLRFKFGRATIKIVDYRTSGVKNFFYWNSELDANIG